MGEFGGLGPDLAAEQGCFDALAPPGDRTGVQRGEDAGREVQRRDVIGDEDADRGGRILVPADRADQSTGRLSREVGAFPFGVGSDGPKVLPWAQMMRGLISAKSS